MLYFQVKWFFLREQLRVVRRFYKNPRFVLVDVVYGFVNLFWNPYRACRKFLQKRGEKNVHVYGETPLSTFQKLMDAVGLCAEDRYVELGSGRGKTCVWAALFRGCRVRGVEWMGAFVRLSRWCGWMSGVEVCFEQNDMRMVDLRDASVVYFYGIHMESGLLDGVFSRMARGSRLVTVSEPVDSEMFEVKKVVSVRFPWGETEAYVHQKKY